MSKVDGAVRKAKNGVNMRSRLWNNGRRNYLTVISDEGKAFMKAVVKWVDGAMFLGESGSGHSVVMDGPEDHGGRNMGVRPMEMLLLGLGGCSSFDVMSILKKTRQNVCDCRVEITAERADAVPAIFTKIHLHFVVSGRSLKETQVKRAVELSADKYCSASIMLEAAGVGISHDYEIVEATSC